MGKTHKNLSYKIFWIIISMLLIFQDQNICYSVRNCSVISELHWKNTFHVLDSTAVMIINCWIRLQRLLLLITQEKRSEYLPGVNTLFGPEHCDILLWILWKTNKADLICKLKQAWLQSWNNTCCLAHYQFLLLLLFCFHLKKWNKVVKTWLLVLQN